MSFALISLFVSHPFLQKENKKIDEMNNAKPVFHLIWVFIFVQFIFWCHLMTVFRRPSLVWLVDNKNARQLFRSTISIHWTKVRVWFFFCSLRFHKIDLQKVEIDKSTQKFISILAKMHRIVTSKNDRERKKAKKIMNASAEQWTWYQLFLCRLDFRVATMNKQNQNNCSRS